MSTSSLSSAKGISLSESVELAATAQSSVSLARILRPGTENSPVDCSEFPMGPTTSRILQSFLPEKKNTGFRCHGGSGGGVSSSGLLQWRNIFLLESKLTPEIAFIVKMSFPASTISEAAAAKTTVHA